MPAQPPQAVRFVLDRAGEQQVAWVRRAAGVGSSLAGLWLAAAVDDWRVRLAGLASSVVGLGWGLTARAAPPSTTDSDYLEVGPAGIELQEYGRCQRLAWAELTRAVLDEDRLAVRLERTSGAPLVLEPRYANAGVYEIFEAIRSHGAAAGLAGCTRDSDD